MVGFFFTELNNRCLLFEHQRREKFTLQTACPQFQKLRDLSFAVVILFI